MHEARSAGQEIDLTSLPIEQLLNLEVVTASKIPQKISEAPSFVSVITADDIKHYGYRSLAEALRSVPGVVVTYDRNYHYLGTRGAILPGDLNTRVLILIDGRRLNDGVYSQGAIGTEFPVDIELIERIEFVPGPGSALYGSSAFFGVLNVITKQGAALNGGEVGLGVASHGTRQLRTSAGGRLDNGFDWLISASGSNSQGQDLAFPEYAALGEDGIARGLDYDRYRRVFAKLSGDGLTFETHLGKRTKGVPTASYGQQFNDPRSRTTDEYLAASVSYDRRLSNTLAFYGSAQLSHTRYTGDYIYGPQTPTVNKDYSQSTTFSTELRLISSGFRNHRLIYGIEYVADTIRQQRNYDDVPFTSYLDIDKPKRSVGLYVQDEIRLSEQLLLNAGLRRDQDSEGGSSTNPRIALIYRASPVVNFKALYGTAFRSANAYERYYVTDAAQFKANSDLRSERIRTTELIAEYFPTDSFRATASLFEYRFKNLIALDLDPNDGLLFQSNTDAARSRGTELAAEWLRQDGSRLRGSLSFQYAQDSLTGRWLSNSPKQLAKLNFTTPFAGNAWRSSAEWQFTSRRKTTLDGEVGGYSVLNLHLLAQRLTKNLELTFSLYNALDKQYADSAGEEHFDNSTPPRTLNAIGQDGRNWRVLGLYRF